METCVCNAKKEFCCNSTLQNYLLKELCCENPGLDSELINSHSPLLKIALKISDLFMLPNQGHQDILFKEHGSLRPC